MRVDGSHAIGVDLGGTKILAGVVARDGTVVRRHERATPQDSQVSVVRELEAAVSELLDATDAMHAHLLKTAQTHAHPHIHKRMHTNFNS